MPARATLICFSVACLVSAALLFSVQPMVAKLVLPRYGGTSAVWTTCMLFFQAVLLIGYGYADLLTRWFSTRGQFLVHLPLLALPILMLPVVLPIDWRPPAADDPTASLLLLLVVMIGAPMVMVSSTAPLLQHWFSKTDYPTSEDPYFLYAVSNTGSLAALVGYPLVIEPLLRLSQQRYAWSGGYVVLVALLTVCAMIVSRTPNSESEPAPLEAKTKANQVAEVGTGRREIVGWLAYAFVPSSWLLAVTARLTTDIAPMPLLWVIPLALYLVTFILVFARWQILPHQWMIRGLPVAITLLLAAVLIASGTTRIYVLIIHLVAFFLGSMVCHGELARRRPPANRLTQFYLWISLGGVLGGLFNAIVAPLLFPALLEFPIVVALALLLTPDANAVQHRYLNLGLIAAGAIPAALLIKSFQIETSMGLVVLFVVAILVMTASQLANRRRWMALGAFAVLAVEPFDVGPNQELLTTARSFYGVHRVTLDAARNDPRTGKPFPRYRRLMHGTTAHGIQALSGQRVCEPLAYYHRNGPLGEVFASLNAASFQKQHIAVVGLGSGAMACYAAKDLPFTFFEIDPAVKRIAETTEYFSYLSECGKGNYEINLGDGRLRLQDAPDQSYSMVILDAFNSDAIPTHLLTREAIALYLQRLQPGGLLLFHISNVHVDLVPVLAGIADEANLSALVYVDNRPFDPQEGRAPSTYFAMARNSADLAGLKASGNWKPTQAESSRRVWTDDYSNIWSVLR